MVSDFVLSYKGKLVAVFFSFVHPRTLASFESARTTTSCLFLPYGTIRRLAEACFVFAKTHPALVQYDAYVRPSPVNAWT